MNNINDNDSFEVVSLEGSGWGIGQQPVDQVTTIAQAALDRAIPESSDKNLNVIRSPISIDAKVPAVALTILMERGIAPATVAEVSKRSGLDSSEILMLLEKIEIYEKQATLPKEQTLRVYKDPFLNLSDPEPTREKELINIFNEELKNSLIRVNGQWLILLKGKGPAGSDNLDVKGGFNRGTLAIDPKTADLMTIRSGLFIDDPMRSADSNKEIKMIEMINDIVEELETDEKGSSPFLKTDTLIYYGRVPKDKMGNPRDELVAKYNLQPNLKVIDEIANPIYKKLLTVTTYCENGNVEALLKNKQLNDKQKLNLSKTLAAAVDVLDKKGIVHGDLKPDNVVMDKDDRFFVIDFGLSQKKENFFQRDQGTPGYKPIFDKFAKDPFDPIAFDLFSLGVCLSQIFFDDRIKLLNIVCENELKKSEYIDKSKVENLYQAYKERLEEYLGDYDLINPEIVDLIMLCLQVHPKIRTDLIDGQSLAKYIREKLDQLI